MDAHTFDRWTVALAQRPSRRTTLRLLAGGLLGSLLASRGSGPVRAQADTDGDQLFDEDELRPVAEGGYGTDPNKADTDGDQANDGLEIWNQDQGLGDPDDPLTPDNPAAPPPPTCIALGGACSGTDQPCCGNDPAAFGYNNVICCPTAAGSACTDIAGTFHCPDPGVPTTGCPAGMTNCGGVCTDLSIDHGNCGTCGHSCGLGFNCHLYECVQACPSGGMTVCNGVCVDLLTDTINCGFCGNACACEFIGIFRTRFTMSKVQLRSVHVLELIIHPIVAVCRRDRRDSMDLTRTRITDEGDTGMALRAHISTARADRWSLTGHRLAPTLVLAPALARTDNSLP